MLNKIWHYDSYDAEHRTLVDRLIASTPKLQQRFQNTLVSIVQHIFNPVAFQKVVETYYERYQPEASWDYSFTRPYRRYRMVPDWKYNDFLVAFNSSLPGLPWGLYEWVSLRAEALKKEFCISWEGDENPPDESCVPFQPYPEDAVIATFGQTTETTTLVPIETIEPVTTETTSLVVETYTSEIVEATTTTGIVEEPTTTGIAEPTTIQSTKSLPSSRNRFLDWFRNLRPMDVNNNVNNSKEANNEKEINNEVNNENEVNDNVDIERNINGQNEWNFNGQNQWNFNGQNEGKANVKNEENVNVKNEGNANEEEIDWNNFDWENVDWNNFQF